jgi:hypothetical protein
LSRLWAQLIRFFQIPLPRESNQKSRGKPKA